jgi:hypothetical protein
VETFCGISWTYMKLRKADWIADKKINILFQIADEKHPDLPDIPLMGDFIRAPADRQVYNFLLAPQEFGRRSSRRRMCRPIGSAPYGLPLTAHSRIRPFWPTPRKPASKSSTGPARTWKRRCTGYSSRLRRTRSRAPRRSQDKRSS